MILEAAVHTNYSPANCFPVMKHSELLMPWENLKGSFLIVKIQLRFFSIEFFFLKNMITFLFIIYDVFIK